MNDVVLQPVINRGRERERKREWIGIILNFSEGYIIRLLCECIARRSSHGPLSNWLRVSRQLSGACQVQNAAAY